MAATRLGENPTGSRGSEQWTCTNSSCSEGQETRLPCEGDGDVIDFNADLRAGCKGTVGEGLIGPEFAAKVRGGTGQEGSAGRLDSAWLRSTSPFVNVEDLFTRLSERFPDPNKQTDLRGEVRNVRCQGNEGVHKYSVRFNDIAERIVDVSEIDLMYDYIRGLPDEVRKEVRRRKPDSLDAAMKDAEEAEQLLSGGRKKDYGGQGRDGRSDSHPPLRPQSQSNDGPVPMDLNRISRIYSLFQDEIKRHIQENRCFNCHAVGH
eukprot:Cvel_24435.t1-p1 / transcript=Cvel_24435.t1 / gene=Cvel_24435 / organism=Chromera_velia_CCMP2878 / gene_product=hypothetical protein / transcript_product=hypothetical protein / location=Cvel_scaffold2641:1-6931(-) / protein_length=261 / sequence_SO=supercontig / SO=protein_coding / is_pseudo=false